MQSFFWQMMEDEQEGNLGGGGGAGGKATTSSETHSIFTDWQFFTEPASHHPPPLAAPCEEFGSHFLEEYARTEFFNCSGNNNTRVGEEIQGGCDVFSRPVAPVVNDDLMKVDGSSVAVNGPVNHGPLVLSPQAQGIKRRKGLAKKVICIPAPAAPSNKPGGEIVPSDLWAWRKYGQKPIKGSPYPRGYYRCSSSKGCSARKQVERSRTDPNMLIITYTSDHNHPWPTQRNALAGSTRSQPSKNNSSATKGSPCGQRPSKSLKGEAKETSPSLVAPSIKVEVQEMERGIGMPKDDGFDQVFQQGYEHSVVHDDFLAEFKDLEPDPLNIFSSGFSGLHELSDKDLDTFSFFDWEETTVDETNKSS